MIMVRWWRGNRLLAAELRRANAWIDELKARILDLTNEPLTVIEGESRGDKEAAS